MIAPVIASIEMLVHGMKPTRSKLVRRMRRASASAAVPASADMARAS